MLAFLLGLVLLETIPVAGLLETGATLQAGDPSQTPAALWFLVVVTALAVLVGRATARLDPAATIISAVPVYLACLVAAIRISPAAYGSVPEGPLGTAWIQALGYDLFNGTERTSALFGLAIILGYLWWRGLRLGRTQASIESARVLFLFSFAVLVVAVAVAAAVRGPSQQALAGRLEFLLPLEAFAGLAALSIARTNSLADDQRSVVWTGASERGPWLWLGLIISGATLILAALVSLFTSYDAIVAGLRDLGPLGELIGAGLEWLTYAILYVVNLVFGGAIEWIINSLQHAKNTLTIPQTPPPPKNTCSNPSCAPNIPPARGIAVAIVLGVVLVVLVCVLIYIVYRAIKSMRTTAIQAEFVEERESLDAGGLFGAQLRGLFAGLRRAPGRIAEALEPGSIRALYRDVLRAAAAAGLPRWPSETPDEYLARLHRTGGLDTPPDAPGRRREDSARARRDDLAVLTEAYDRDRYGAQPPPEAERRGLQARAHRILAWLRERARLAG